MIVNRTLLEILNSRQDISDYLFHFTKRRDAIDSFKSILLDNAIKDIKGVGYLCFSETPLTMLPSMFKIFEKYEDPLYAPFGIGIKKDVFYKAGGRPVIYGDQEEKLMLPEKLKWRFVYMHPDRYDYSWLREWRIPCSKYELNFKDSFAVVGRKDDVFNMHSLFLELDDIDIDSQPEDGGVLTEYIASFTRKYKVVSMEEIEEVNNMTKQELTELLNNQDDQYGASLGSTWG